TSVPTHGPTAGPLRRWTPSRAEFRSASLQPPREAPMRGDLLVEARRALVERELATGELRFPGGVVPVASLRRTELDAAPRTTVGGVHRELFNTAYGLPADAGALGGVR